MNSSVHYWECKHLKPEESARQSIDQLLTALGWEIQGLHELNLGASLCVAVREFRLESGSADYLLFVDMQAVGVVEAKPAPNGKGIPGEGIPFPLPMP